MNFDSSRNRMSLAIACKTESSLRRGRIENYDPAASLPKALYCPLNGLGWTDALN